ncbi:nodulation protein NodH [Ponticoccus sp. SC2-23]|uniref:sulfotransferase family 2 domain-containing protein n=1 Tax=Alexandriicola marinus TaxID=2081710 RepID=UPI000FD7B3D5|nr:sulfotransferase family 2 domain-containing protein [Alexandriicola marinus]MBM1220664.1 nodulation protein NodH [Ponticoccus sp. SC6-9]MBM1225923.1 nodulation protein NodH [Ponticoccus sp. SC6-15]MBM1231220.1 nodulation protein NodH [Ponticoccus sp. SC6-38]MBM1235919.1 nodulation protein NodH [Ponticoccus sp. SC6-45]MBM1240242.1 nodulation protein NodH [Ponticoccus sp. SC6-49]MBM1244777.1 nodulation protein NodH [Ponticoccus sp. SC2-64]MBM1249393.1 nodulation protein NodH [Ponticoccus sp
MASFDYFVVFAEMRTGSNFLESNLNAFDGVTCHGEAFNPHFIGYPNRTEVLGITQAERDVNPKQLIAAIKAERAGRETVISGFRYFNDHDPRILDTILNDPRCAKIVLTRNPVESYVSRKIAASTGQWKLTNVKHARSEKIRFDAAEFEKHAEAIQNFQIRILNALQRTGQTAFYLDYEDLQDVAVMNGIASWLGVPARLEGLDKKLKKQNPEPLEDKVTNYAEMERGLAGIDRFNLTRTPNFEPRRGALIPHYVAAPESPLIYQTLRSGPEATVRAWLSALDDGKDLLEKFNQKTLRRWKADHAGHRSFTVIRHPVARAHAAYCERILPASGPNAFPEIRQNLRQHFGLDLPEGKLGSDYDIDAHRNGFKAFLAFVKANLNGQTNLRIDQAWSSQTGLLQGMTNFLPPEMIIREEEMAEELVRLAHKVGLSNPPPIPDQTDPHRPALEKIYDAEIEAATREAVGRDYDSFSFGNWA